MKQLFEFSFFLAGATALHLSIGYIAPSGQEASAGEGGTAAVTLAAATTSVQTMVAAWEKPVSVSQTVAQPQMTIPDIARPVTPSADGAVARPAALSPPPVSDAPKVPDIDRSVAPPPKPEIAATRPVKRPPQAAKPAAMPTPPQQPRQAAKQPKPAQTAVPQKAAGSAKKQTAGAGGSGVSQKAKPGNGQKILVQWGGQIRTSIERRKRYPSGTRATGTVTLAISVHTRGAVVGVAVRGSSGVAQIDRAAIAAVQSARIAAAPKGLTAGVHSFTLPMKFAP